MWASKKTFGDKEAKKLQEEGGGEYNHDNVDNAGSIKEKEREPTRDRASSEWLQLAALCLFRAQSVSKNKSICDCAVAGPQSDRSTLI